jgi:phosphoenolpyruvate carboxylase
MDLHDRTVNQDVRELGALLGEVLAAQRSEADFETVEALRTTAIDYRDGEMASREALHELLDGLAPDEERAVARAFTTYFELINLAEERERVRAVHGDPQAAPLPDSLHAAADELPADER